MTHGEIKRVRTCVGCSQRSDKVALYRVVRSSDGTVSFDGTGRMPGRGAYVCSKPCFDDAVRKGRLARALKTTFGQEEASEIAAELEQALASADAR